MKKQLLFIIVFLATGLFAIGQGNENFTNYPETANAYHDGTFTGMDGSTWSYTQCRGDSVIVAPSPTFGKKRPLTSKIISGTLHNGCGTISFDYKQPFTTAVNLNLFVNGLLVKNVTSTAQGTLYNSGPVAVNTPGDFTLMFKQADSSNSGQVTIDNVIWTAFSGGPTPEPTNYPTNFAATNSPFTINLSWTDATGAQLPAAYIVLASDLDNIIAPVDGTPVPDDANLADGHGALNILQGVQVAAFGNLPPSKQYYFKIFPYTNSGALINFKTDGTAPSATATTSNTVVIDSIHFTNKTFGNWILKNVTGAEAWAIDSIHGINGGPCGKMSGYAGQSNVNEDWLISPAMNFNNYTNEALSFQSAYKYTGPPLEALISNDYDGITNPGDFSWTPLTATWSAGNYAWTPSGTINVSGTSGTQVYIGFKYTSDAIAASTWEIDDIVITGDLSSTATHFTPAWTGNPLYPMMIVVTQAQFDATDLVAGDEIGIFDGVNCVGMVKLSQIINPANSPTYSYIVCSRDDPGTPIIDGFIDGHPIVYKIWKQSINLETVTVTHIYPYTPLYASETFVQNETDIVRLFGAIVPATRILQNITIPSGQTNCYNATQTITVGGNSTTFMIQNGGSATMIAGQNILYLPGTVVQSGGYMWGYVAPDGPYCISPSMPSVFSGEVETASVTGKSSFKIYPNPTTGRFILDLEFTAPVGKVSVDVYGLRGDKVLTEILNGENKHEFSISDKPVGIYFVRVISGTRVETEKIIKQ